MMLSPPPQQLHVALLPHNNNKRRLVLTIYRSLLRWCQQVVPDPTLPLDQFIPPLRGKTMDNVTVFRAALRESFRDDIRIMIPTTTKQQQQQEKDEHQKQLTQRIQQGLDGLKQLREIQPDLLAYRRQWGDRIRKQQQQKQTQSEQHSCSSLAASSSFVEREWVQDKLNAVSWLPQVVVPGGGGNDGRSTLKNNSTDPATTTFPLFPLHAPLFHSDTLAGPFSSSHDPTTTTTTSLNLEDNDSGELMPLPLFTPQYEISVPGMEVPLQIFEPRYRQLYSDLMSHNSKQKQQVVVPFCHPLVAGQFATHGLIHQVTNVREIADETNGKMQYLVNHIVLTKPVVMEQILNPHVWATRETYLQVKGQIFLLNNEDDDDDDDDDQHVIVDDRTDDLYHDVYEPVHQVLEEWKRETSHPLATKSLLALDHGDGLWALVHVWNLHFQQELLHLQIGIATQVKHQAEQMAKNKGPSSSLEEEVKCDHLFSPWMGLTPDIILQAQQPHRRRLLQLMLDTSLLVPALLAMDGQEKCQYLMDMVQQERQFLKTNSF